MGLQSADLMIRGGVLALLLLIAVLLLREHARATVARLGAAFAISTAAYVICSFWSHNDPVSDWQAPLYFVGGANCVLLWLLASALFDEEFHLRSWHAALWVAMGLLTVTCLRLFGSSALHPFLQAGQLLATLSFAALALLRTVATWRADLLEVRRRLRLFVVAAAALHLMISSLVRFLPMSARAVPLWSIANAAILLLIVGTITWLLLRTDIEALLPVEEAAPPPAPAADEVYTSPSLIAEVERSMTRDQLYRDGALTIGALAAKLGLLEYKVRRIINQGLGYRNFNAFLNHYRVEHAKAMFAERRQADTSVLSVAMDCGFQSLGPFNRAFKAQTGMTPSEFRRIRPVHSKIG
ncbi:MAG TPA: helix-turn-helix domain-containing protein [Steroidobacteraceae bacterium]|jgi:AraC-like DNA-binding protein|nr:helix-turn-helix domain-containing protein [Steroidobacteraceae bacterium]